MMHLHMVGLALGGAIAIRFAGFFSLMQVSQRTMLWSTRWRRAVMAFVVPPLLLIATATAIISMDGATSYLPLEELFSHVLSVVFLWIGLLVWMHIGWAACRTQLLVMKVPAREIENTERTHLAIGRVIDVPVLFSAQIGLWSSELVVSKGLIEHLDDDHLAAVLAHESGHAHYRDTFWFFWLGGLQRLTAWLPYSEALWQELLLLREIRADRWAARSVDNLVLAESLMSVITAPLMPLEAVCAGFSCAAPRSRSPLRRSAAPRREPWG